MKYYEDFLIHYGTIGMKWGIRRYQNPDGSLTDAGRKRYDSGNSPMWGLSKIDDSYASQKRPVTSRVKERTNADYEQINEIQKWEDAERRHILRGKQLLHRSKILAFKLSRITDDMDVKAGLPKLKTSESMDDTVKNVNPSKGTHLATGNNCCLCTIGYDLRRRGYDVIAKQNAPINLLYDIGPEDVSWMYGFPKEIHTKTSNGLQKALSKQPDGSRGAAFCSWSGGQGGHVVAYEIVNGRPVLFDAQTGTKYTKVSDLFDDVDDTSFIRLDNKEPNYNFVKIAVE